MKIDSYTHFACPAFMAHLEAESGHPMVFRGLFSAIPELLDIDLRIRRVQHAQQEDVGYDTFAGTEPCGCWCFCCIFRLYYRPESRALSLLVSETKIALKPTTGRLQQGRASCNGSWGKCAWHDGRNGIAAAMTVLSHPHPCT